MVNKAQLSIAESTYKMDFDIRINDLFWPYRRIVLESGSPVHPWVRR